MCCTPFGNDWTWFVQNLTAPDVRWFFTSDKATSRWMTLFQRPNLITPFATLRTVLLARNKRAALLITIDSRLSFWCALWCRLLAIEIQHYVFSFNFPQLPVGWKLPVFRYAFAQLSRIRIHSTMEKRLYGEYFHIPPERIHFSRWAMNKPEIEPATALEQGRYICAIGGNARDYKTLLEASLKLPDIPMVWVVRPENISGLSIPHHIRVVSNIPYPAAMNYLSFAQFMVLPLRDAEVPCGHVTLVSAMYLGKAIVATNSAGVADYVQEGSTGLLSEPANPQAMADRMQELWNDPIRTDVLGQNGRLFAEANCSDKTTEAEMTAYFASLGLCSSP